MTPRLKRLLRLALALAVPPGVLSPRAAPAESPPSLPETLRQHLEQPAFQYATWGVAVHDATSGLTLFETNSHRLLKPASNAKLFTGALALHTLGPQTRFTTDFVPTGPISRRGVLRGDLIVHGGGDFSLAARFHQGNPTQAVHSLVLTLQNAGLRRIEGNLVADDSFFAGPPFGNGWTWDDLQYYYGAEVSALSLEDNVLDLEFTPGPNPGDPVTFTSSPGASFFEFRTDRLTTTPPSTPREIRVHRAPGSRLVHCSGSLPAGSEPWKDAVTIPTPPLFFVHRLREALRHAGIPVHGDAIHVPGARNRLPPDASRAHPISVVSPPLASLVAGMMKPSQNLYAQLLLLQVGARHPHPDALTTEDAGVAALQAFLEHADIPTREVRLDDGSGLSRSSLVTPAAVVALLRFMDQHPHREAFLDALPIAGKDGTLRRRFVGTPLEGNLRAKTGSLRYVSTLSGFVTNTTGRRLVFSAFLNAYHPPPSAPSGRAALDQLAALLAESR